MARKKTIKQFRATFRDDDISPTLFTDYLAQDRGQAVIIARHLPAKRISNPSLKRRRLRRIKPLNGGWLAFKAVEKSLYQPEHIRPKWWQRIWQYMADLWLRWQDKSRITHVIGGPAKIWDWNTRKGPRWEMPKQCPQCGEWSLWSAGARHPNWCGSCSGAVRLQIKNWRHCHG